MADLKISELTNLTAADPANDMIPIVDVSATPPASGSTKRISINNILACSPTATLASATISGDLTVRTNKLAVTSAGVGFGTTAPAYPAHFRTTNPVIAIQDDTSAATGVGGTMNFLGFTSGTSGANIFAQIKGVKTAGSAGGEYQVFTSDSAGNSVQRYLIDSTGVSTWSVAGTTAMILNSTGLGIGTTVLGGNKLAIGSTSDTSATTNAINIVTNRATITTTCNGAVDAAGTTINYSWANGGQGPLIFRNTTISNVMTLDASGNVGIGVTPSAKLHVEGGGAQARFSIASASDARHEYYRNGIREGLITWDANVIGLYATQSSGEVVIASSNTLRVRVKAGGQVRFVPLASDPAGAEAGDVYYNSTSNKLKCYNGTTWNDLF